jgi:AraC family transcriptional regulator, L-rhamnose operon regulatory protein RhaS
MLNQELLQQLSKISPEEEALLSGQALNKGIYMDATAASDIVDAAKLLQSGRLITIRPHTRFAHFPEHSHNYVEVVYMCQGSTTHIANGTSVTLQQGELLFFGQGAIQEILPAGKDDLAVNFIILPQFFDKVLEMLDTDKAPLRTFLTESLGSENTGWLHFRVADILPVQNLVENLIYTLLNESEPNRRSICQTTMGLLFMELMNHTDRLITKNMQEDAVVRVLRYIEEYYQAASLTEIAGELNYDLYWLSREIRRRTGNTFQELLQHKRLSQATYYLRCTSLKVDDIGRAVGYSNLSYFHRIFKETYGLTPKKYRDSQR